MAGENPNPTLVEAPESAGAAIAAAEKTGAERRAHKRLRPHELRDLQARLASGADIRLIDLSRGGAQFETDRRFLPNSSIALRLVTPDSTFVVNGRVVRSRIVRLEQGGLGYNVAVAFLETLQQAIENSDAAAAAAAAAEPATPPAEEPTTPQAPADSLAVRFGASTPVELVSAADAALHAEAVSNEGPTTVVEFTEVACDVTAEERAAFEATVVDAPAMVTVTAEVEQSSEELRDLFDGNSW